MVMIYGLRTQAHRNARPPGRHRLFALPRLRSGLRGGGLGANFGLRRRVTSHTCSATCAILVLMMSRRVRPSGEHPLKIVAIGGGTGLSALLHGLKQVIRAPEPRRLDIDITAIVTVTDDGGSSGRLHREFDVLPPGDIRNCIVALSEDEAMLSKLFQYRFSEGRGLKGHSFGNLFLTALTEITGDFAKAVKVSSEILASLGRIYPSTDSNVQLEAELENGRIVTGETKISKSRSRIQSIRLIPRVCRPLPETLEAIERADLITFG